ncbi:MAG: wax ester/triacylglycerol synthase family O-acyltransferase [Betaproteobacteria bacterium]|nr:wax ester/triacylglycerol synthase family O-acyltransferase [Betaproteobacteria bacterium]MBK8106178.1 wax ester/triacylglycerol synthase family O-acyltransferase [Betaproteobacteria bacterium]
MKSLSGVDAAFLHLETPETPMHVGSVSLFDLPPRYRRDFHAEVKRQLGRRLHLAPVLHRKLAPMPLQFANPVWVDDDAVDLDHHVQRVTLAPPGTMTQFDDCIGRLHAELLDRSRPLWRLHVIDGLASGQVGYYFKAHHAALDGQAGIVLARTLFDLSPRPPPVPRAKGALAGEHPGLVELGAAALRHDAGQIVKLVRHLPDVVRTLAGLLGPAKAAGAPGRLRQNFAFGPPTPLNVPISAERGFAGLSLPLDALKALATAHDAKLNDIVLALCSGALRRYLAHHGGIPKKPLTAAMPISLREAGNTEFTTQATMPLVNLHTHVADPVRRLHAIRDGADAVKAMVQQAKGVVPMDFPSIGVPWVLHGLAELYGRTHLAGVMPVLANVVISNVPGPRVPLYAAGAHMSTYWPVSIVEHGLGLNITVISYAGAMGFGFTTARAAVPDAHRLTQALAEAFDELRARTGPSPPRAARRRDQGAAPPSRRTR